MTQSQNNLIEKLQTALNEADTLIIGAGAGLSTAAGYTYSGERFRKYFFDFEEKYCFHDMYSGGFTQFESDEEKWAFWSRNIWINRYAPIPSDLYEKLYELVKDKDYFVITTNVDHCFQRAGFDKKDSSIHRAIMDCSRVQILPAALRIRHMTTGTQC